MDGNDDDNNNHPSKRIPYAHWPDDAPFKCEEKILTIIIGRSSLHWAMHGGGGNEDECFPYLFWNTPHVDMQEVLEEEETPCEVLERYTAKQSHSLLFGDSDEADIYDVSLAAVQRISPAISVYVISDNNDDNDDSSSDDDDENEQERAILYMFEKVPSRIVKLQTTDFYPPDSGVYQSLTTDLAAAMVAARKRYGDDKPTLVIAGNEVISYAAMDGSSKFIGGGVTAGISIRLRSLADSVTGMPRIKLSDFVKDVQAAKESGGGLPTFATDTKSAILSSTCSEITCQLRNIVKRFVAETTKNDATTGGSTTIMECSVVVTGGDGKLLYELLDENASGIVTIDSNLTLPSTVNLYNLKNLSHYGMGSVLLERCNELSAIYPDNDLLYRLIGSRVAKAFPKPDENNDFFRRGLVLYSKRNKSFDDHEFRIRYDDNGTEQNWTVTDLYDGLVAYGEIGEKPTKGKDVDWVIQRKAKSAELIEELLVNSEKAQKRKDELAAHSVDGSVSKYLAKSAETTYEAKISKLAADQEVERKQQQEPPRKRPKVDNGSAVDPSLLLRKRIAKFFPIEDPNNPGVMKDEVFFGTLTKVTNRRHNWFQVVYDDGDREEFNMDQVNYGVKLYKSFKDMDPALRSGRSMEKDVANSILAEHGRETAMDVEPEQTIATKPAPEKPATSETRTVADATSTATPLPVTPATLSNDTTTMDTTTTDTQPLVPPATLAASTPAPAPAPQNPAPPPLEEQPVGTQTSETLPAPPAAAASAGTQPPAQPTTSLEEPPSNPNKN